MNNELLKKIIKEFPLIPLSEDFERMVFDKGKIKKMELKLVMGENFGITGEFGTGKTTLLNYLECFIKKNKLGVPIRISESMCNEDIFFRKILFQLLEKKLVKDIFKKNADEIVRSIEQTQSLEDFLRTLIYYEPRKQLDHSRVITLYREFLAQQSDKGDIDFVFNSYTLKNLVAEIFRKCTKRLFLIVDDYDKFMIDPLSKEGGENRLGLFLTSLKEFTEFEKTTWVFVLPRQYFEKFHVRMPFSDELSFLSIFTEVFAFFSFDLKNTRQYLTKKAEALDMYLNDLIEEDAIKLVYVLTGGNPKMINYLIKSSCYHLNIHRKKRIDLDSVLNILENDYDYDGKDLYILKYITLNKQTFSNDKMLLDILNIENINLMLRLEKLQKKKFLTSKFYEGIKYFRLRNVE